MSLEAFLSRPLLRVVGAIEEIAFELKRLRVAVEVSNKIAAFRLYEAYYEGGPDSENPISIAVNGILEETVNEFRTRDGEGDERPAPSG